MKKMLLLMLFIVITSELSFADWALLNGTPSTFWYVGLAYSNGKVYLYESTGGGGNGFWEYDVAGDNWRQRANTPITGKGAYLAADTTTGLIYWHSGYQRFFVYEPVIDSWTELSPSPVAAWSDGYVMTNSDMCVNPVTQKIYWHNGSRVFYEYDISSDQWTQKDSTPVTGNGDMVIHPGLNKVYWHQGFDPNTGHQNGFYEYDIINDQWQVLSFTPVTDANGGLAILPARDRIFWSRGGLSAEFYEYNIATDTWNSLGTTPRNGQFGNITADWIGNYIYYYAGYNVTPDSIFWQYSDGVKVKEYCPEPSDKNLRLQCPDLVWNDNIDIQITINEQQRAEIELIDVCGRVLFCNSILLNAGMNCLELQSSELTRGIYFITVNTLHIEVVRKIIVMR